MRCILFPCQRNKNSRLSRAFFNCRKQKIIIYFPNITKVMRRTCKFLLVCGAAAQQRQPSWCVVAFSPSGAGSGSRTAIVACRHRPSSSCKLGTIGNEDFSKIFGSQEAAERRTRDLAREYHPRPNTTDNTAKEESSTGNNKHKQQQQQSESELNKESQESEARKTKVVGKYVPPPGLWKK